MPDQTDSLFPAHVDELKRRADAARLLSPFERLVNLAGARRLFILLALAALWQAYGAWLSNPLIFPPDEIRAKLHPYPALSDSDERTMKTAMAKVTGA